MCIIGIVSVIYNTVSFLDSIMLVAIISFVSSVSISRFIGEVEYSMAQINEIIELIAALLIFLGSIIAVISAIGIVKFQDVFYEAMHLLRVLRLSVLLTLVGVLIYFTNEQSFFSVRLLLSIVLLI